MCGSEHAWPAADVLTELTELAGQRCDRDTAWQAADAAIQVLAWRDELSVAADLAERTVLDTDLHSTGLVNESLPFGLILVAAEAYAKVPALPRLQHAAGAVPADSVLGQHLSWLGRTVSESSAAAVLARNRPWEKRFRKAAQRDRELLARDWNTLSSKEVDLLWSAAERMNDLELARRLRATTGTGPTRWPFVTWFATWLVHQEHLEEASTVMLESRAVAAPSKLWEVLPVTAPLDPDLRRVLTPGVRNAYLETVRNPFPLEQA